MVDKEGGEPASECKIEKSAIKYGRNGATHWGRHTNWPGFLNSTGSLNRRQRMLRFLVGTETTKARSRT